MSNLNRGIMKFDGADSLVAILLSSTLILGFIGCLVLWALGAAYSVTP